MSYRTLAISKLPAHERLAFEVVMNLLDGDADVVEEVIVHPRSDEIFVRYSRKAPRPNGTKRRPAKRKGGYHIEDTSKMGLVKTPAYRTMLAEAAERAGEEVLTPAQVADMAGVARTTAQQAIRKYGELPDVSSHPYYMLTPRSAAERWVERYKKYGRMRFRQPAAGETS